MDYFYTGPVFALSGIDCGYPSGNLQVLRQGLSHHLDFFRAKPRKPHSSQETPIYKLKIPLTYILLWAQMEPVALISLFSFWHSIICNRHQSINPEVKMLAQKEKELKSLMDSNAAFWPLKFMLISTLTYPISCLSNPLRVYINQIQLCQSCRTTHKFISATSPLSRGWQ